MAYNAGNARVKKALSIYQKEGAAKAADYILSLDKGKGGLQLRRRFEYELLKTNIMYKNEDLQKLIATEGKKQKKTTPKKKGA